MGDMMLKSYKDILNVSIDRDVKQFLIDWSNARNLTLSEGTNFLLNKMIRDLEISWKTIPTIKCKCGAEYSSKLPKCPSCSDPNG